MKRAKRSKWAHGTLTGYTHYKCRCDSCKQAKKQWRSNARQKNLAIERVKERDSSAKRRAAKPDYVRVYGKAYKTKHGARYRDISLQQKYGVSERQWDLMFERQKGLCPICLKPIYKFRDPSGRKASPVEHDHKTKRVRGLACYRCNRTKIGTNTAETAARLLAYLTSTFDGRDI